jgi:hypothetical protein
MWVSLILMTNSCKGKNLFMAFQFNNAFKTGWLLKVEKVLQRFLNVTFLTFYQVIMGSKSSKRLILLLLTLFPLGL